MNVLHRLEQSLVGGTDSETLDVDAEREARLKVEYLGRTDGQRNLPLASATGPEASERHIMRHFEGKVAQLNCRTDQRRAALER